MIEAVLRSSLEFGRRVEIFPPRYFSPREETLMIRLSFELQVPGKS